MMDDGMLEDAKWKRIQEVLGAEAQGKTPHAVASKKTLFGIESSVEAQIRNLMRPSDLGQDERRSELLAVLAPLADTLDERLIVGRADRYFVHVGRSHGFYIPSYPFDPAGDLKCFLSEYGVSDVPGWYRALGIDKGFDALAGFTLLAYREAGEDTWRVSLAQGADLVDVTRFLPLSQSGILENADFAVLCSIRGALVDLGLVEGEGEETANV
ncbi:MAG: hypothetical protein ACOX69_02210 [Coriobacteriales bacterium]|jgi:hypothetical protein